MLKPLNGLIIVKRTDADTVTPSGIIIPATGQERPDSGVVVEVGDTVLDEIQKGDNILFERFAGDPVDIDGHPCLFMRESDIIAVVD